jgi:arginyl-tRNA synthetase
MPALEDLLAARLSAALATVTDGPAEPLIARSAHADFQINAALPLAHRLGKAPREIASQLLAAADLDGLATGEVSGPGFINLTVATDVLWAAVAEKATDARLGLTSPLHGQRIIVEYSGPNVAKEMHVGHLRSTVIGDAIARTLEFLGADVIRQNHIGDWGTNFGMLIAYLAEHGEPATTAGSGDAAITRLDRLYRAARAVFVSDPAFVDRSRAQVVALQAGDPAAMAAWQGIVAESKRYFAEVYDLLGIGLTDADIDAESFYNPALVETAATLAELGIAEASAGALCVFFDGVRGPDGLPTPLIVRKSDGGFGYAATDLAAVRHRVANLHADRIIYVVDARQALHFRMVLDTARRAGWLPETVVAEHVLFGTVLGADGKPFKTRSGDTIRLISLLNEAIERAAVVIAEKNPELPPSELAVRAREVGIGAVKYADLSTGRTRDYVFDLDRMVSLAGNTGVYLQYAHARVRSILRKAGDAHRSVDVTTPMVDAERRMVLRLDEFAGVVLATAETSEPHRLCTYLFELAQTLSAFWDACPVLKAPDERTRANRLALCQLTADTLRRGLSLLGIAAPERL